MSKITEFRSQVHVDTGDWRGMTDADARAVAASAHQTAQIDRLRADHERNQAFAELGAAIIRFLGFGGAHATR